MRINVQVKLWRTMMHSEHYGIQNMMIDTTYTGMELSGSGYVLKT